MTHTITLPFPPKELNPNKRLHWAVKSAKTKIARQTAYDIAKVYGLKAPSTEKIAIRWQFYPPDRRRRDDDNLLLCCKGYRDGIADALGINDRRFVSTPEIMDEVVKGGKVVVTLGEIR